MTTTETDPHRCELPLTWRTRTLTAGVCWTCDCGTQRVAIDTERPGKQRYRWVQVHDLPDRIVVG